MIRAMGARVRCALFVACLAVAALAPAHASALGLQSIGPSFDQPVFATSPPGDPRLFVVERPGYIQVVDNGIVSQFLDIHTRTTTEGERGLLSMAFDPNYSANGLFYVFYTGDGVDAGGALGDIHIDEFRAGADPNVADPLSRRTVWTFSHGASNHNGGQLQFGPDGYLYITVGDNANGSNAQSLAAPYGKVFRIDPHGAGEGAHGIPATNPFAGVPGATQETWALGLRNPFRFSFDHLTGDLIIGDVGAGSREEIDYAPVPGGGGRGSNFGWPCREGFSAGPGGCGGSFVDPVFDYPHQDPGGDVAHGCAIIGGYVYRGSQAPEIAGRYLYADLCTAELRSIQLGLPLASNDRPESGPGALGTPRSFGEDATCNLYVMNTDTVFRIVGSASGAAPACLNAPAICPCPQSTRKKKRKCRRKGHHKKKHRAADSKKKHKKKCKKRKKKRARLYG